MQARRAEAAVRQLGVPEIYEAGWTVLTGVALKPDPTIR